MQSPVLQPPEGGQAGQAMARQRRDAAARQGERVEDPVPGQLMPGPAQLRTEETGVEARIMGHQRRRLRISQERQEPG